MKVSEKVLISTRKLIAYPNNPRKISQESLNRLCDSIRANGYWEHRPAAVEPVNGTNMFYVLDGNQRLKAMRRMKRPEMPCVIYTDLTDEERNDIILRSNINNGEWVPELASLIAPKKMESTLVLLLRILAEAVIRRLLVQSFPKS